MRRSIERGRPRPVPTAVTVTRLLGVVSMPNFHVTVHGADRAAMADLVRVHGVRVYPQTLDEQPGECRVDAVADPAVIDRLVAAGYRVDRHEDVDEAGKDSLRHVGRGNRFTDTGQR